MELVRPLTPRNSSSRPVCRAVRRRIVDADKPSNPRYLKAALELTRSGTVIVIDDVARDGAVVKEQNDDPGVHGVRSLVDEIAQNPKLEATALQTVGVKGWDGFLLVRRN